MANKWDLMRLPRERTEREGKGACLPTGLQGFHYFNTRYKWTKIYWLVISPGNPSKSGFSRAVGRKAHLRSSVGVR